MAKTPARPSPAKTKGERPEDIRPEKPGRKSIYSDALATTICERLIAGQSLRAICRDDDMPNIATVSRWLADERHITFREQYAHARAAQADLLVDEILEIADDGRNDTYINADGVEVVNHDHIQRSKLRIDARKWLAAKMLPKKYGDKLDLNVHDDRPTLEQVDARLAALYAKARGDDDGS